LLFLFWILPKGKNEIWVAIFSTLYITLYNFKQLRK
jgi:hypothetical protein